jgi:hypothetical protein
MTSTPLRKGTIRACMRNESYRGCRDISSIYVDRISDDQRTANVVA